MGRGATLDIHPMGPHEAASLYTLEKVQIEPIGGLRKDAS